MRAAPDRQFLGYAAGLALFVALLADQVASLSLFRFFPAIGHAYLAKDISGPAPVFAHQLLWVLQGTVAVGYVLLPIGVASYYVTRGARHPLFYAVLAIVAILGLPSLRFVVLGIFRGGATALWAVVLTGVFVGGLAGVLRVACARGPDDPDEHVPVSIFLNLGFVVVFLVGTLLGGAVAGDTMAGFVETDSPSPPDLSVEASYTPVEGDQNRGVLTLRHSGGETVQPERLTVEGEGFADVEGADQTEPGRWRGETSHGDAESMVGPGDVTTIGVQTDCRVILSDHYRGTSTVFRSYECEKLRNESAQLPSERRYRELNGRS